ncbi:MAG: DAK2 domain-containing protein [Dehalococcoidia bacterium]
MATPRPQEPPGAPISPPPIDGPALARALAGGAAALAQQADAINVINVFPVPDGDTGTNMSMTMRATAAAAHAATGSAHDVARAAADAALMGAKGNSGVILSQILTGFAAMPPAAALDARELASALDRGREAAYRVVSAPREGTILTAIAEAARAAQRCADAGGTAPDALAAAAEAARDAVANSPNLLPVLKEAGVVDSGAQGLYVMLEGMLRALRGEPPTLNLPGAGHIDESWLRATRRLHDGDAAGYCTEFVVTGHALDRDAIRRALSDLGESVLVVGGEGLVRAHVHTADPRAAFAYARTLGTVSHEKADDMRAQIDALAARAPGSPRTNGSTALTGRLATSAFAVVAVGAGDGIDALLRSLGAAAVVPGGQTMNPSAGEIAEAIVSTGAPAVIVLPDNKNIVLAAQQAAEAVPARVAVLPAFSVPQGVAALVAMNTESSFEENLAAMQHAIAHIATAEVTRAVRATTIAGRAVAVGQAIGIIDGELAVAEASIGQAVRSTVARMIAGRDAPLVTLYYGDGADEAAAAALASGLRAAHGCEVEVVFGGQPHYPYLIGVD